MAGKSTLAEVHHMALLETCTAVLFWVTAAWRRMDLGFWVSSFFPNSDSLGLLTLKAVGRRRVHGCRPGRCLGVSVSRWLSVSVVSRWCHGGVTVVSRWCLGGVSVVSRRWCLVGGVSVVVSRWYLVGTLVVSWRGLGGVYVVSTWCLRGVYVVSTWCRYGVLFVSRWCLGDASVVSWRCVRGVSVVSR